MSASERIPNRVLGELIKAQQAPLSGCLWRASFLHCSLWGLMRRSEFSSSLFRIRGCCPTKAITALSAALPSFFLPAAPVHLHNISSEQDIPDTVCKFTWLRSVDSSSKKGKAISTELIKAVSLWERKPPFPFLFLLSSWISFPSVLVLPLYLQHSITCWMDDEGGELWTYFF